MTLNDTFEKLTEEDLAALEGRNIMKPVTPPKIMPVAQLEQILTAAQKAVLELQNAHSAVDGEKGTVDKRFAPEHRREAFKRIETKYAEAITGAAARISEAVDLATAQEPMWTRSAYLLRTSFSDTPAEDATIRGTWITRLSRAPGNTLLDFARLAAAQQDIALAAVLAEELLARDDTTEHDIRKVRRGDAIEISGLLNTIPGDDTKARRLIAEIQIVGQQLAVGQSGGGVENIKLGLMQAAL